VFQAYVDLINSEREALWARHNTLLLANSLIIGALAISPTVGKGMGGACHARGGPSGQRRLGLTPSSPAPSPQRLSSTFPTPSPKPSATAHKRECIRSCCL
jgi:hypothetical protein